MTWCLRGKKTTEGEVEIFDLRRYVKISCKKMIRISVKRVPAHTGVLNEKKHFQFSFHKADDKATGENVISVDVND